VEHAIVRSDSAGARKHCDIILHQRSGLCEAPHAAVPILGVTLNNNVIYCTFEEKWVLSGLTKKIGGPSKMTITTSNILVFFLAEGYMIVEGVLI
jgi:hypothetical protein